MDDDIALLANSPAQAKSLLHCLEWAAGGIDFHSNANKTEYMCFNQRGDISTIKGGSLKLVDKFTYQEWHQHTTRKGSDSYWYAISNMEVRTDQ